MRNSKRSVATAEIAIRFFIRSTTGFAHDSPHDFAGKGMLNDLN